MKFFDNQAVSADAESSVIELDQFESFSFQVSVTGSLVGMLYVEVKNFDADDWSEADHLSILSADTYPWLGWDYCFRFMRLRFDWESGSGTIDAPIRGKTMHNGNRRVLGVIS